MNKLTIIGNLTKNPELRSTQDGTPVCGFTVAVNRPKGKDKDRDPGADFFNVSVWRGLGEVCAKYLEKGKKVAVTGRISLRTWEKDGKHGASLEVTAEDVEFLSSKSAPVDEQTGYEVVDPDGLPY